MSTSEFDSPSLITRYVTCPRCFQPLSPVKVRCGRCGAIDRRRVLKSATDLALGTVAFLGALGVVFAAFLDQCM